MLCDPFGRVIDTLRISVTDRCNFSCRYCMPLIPVRRVPAREILRFEAITRIARCFLDCGGRKLRLTGGEPLCRKDLAILVAQLTALHGLRDLGLTTNGSALKAQAAALWDAGLRRINMSLDTLDPGRFQWICLRDAFHTVWEGFETAAEIGFQLKLNVVALRGISEGEVIEFVELAAARGITVRFIEFMPLCGMGGHTDLHFPLRTIHDWIAARFALTPLPRGTDPACTFRIGDTAGCVGFIASLAEPFCHRCSRLRLTADGHLRPCLFSNDAYDVKPALAASDDDGIMAVFRETVAEKPAGHGMNGRITPAPADMPLIQLVGG